MSSLSSLFPSALQAVALADNAPWGYEHPTGNNHPSKWTEDGRPVLAFHLCQEDCDNPDITPVGWIRLQVHELLLHSRSSGVDADSAFEVRSDCVYLAKWVLDGGMKRIDEEIARQVSAWRMQRHFPEQMKGTCGESLCLAES